MQRVTLHNGENNRDHLHISRAGQQIHRSYALGITLTDIPAPALVSVVIPTVLIASEEAQYVECFSEPNP